MDCKKYIDFLQQTLLLAINGEIEKLQNIPILEKIEECSGEELGRIDALIARIVDVLEKEREKIASEIRKKSNQSIGLNGYKSSV